MSSAPFTPCNVPLCSVPSVLLQPYNLPISIISESGEDSQYGESKYEGGNIQSSLTEDYSPEFEDAALTDEQMEARYPGYMDQIRSLEAMIKQSIISSIADSKSE